MDVADNPAKEEDNLSHGFKVFGDVWTLAIVRVLAEATQRFNDLQRSLGNVSPTTLTDRLKKLEQLGLIAQRKHTIDKLSVIYTLTEKGKRMLPVLEAIENFSRKFL